MARVTFEYELPAEQEAVEAAIMGRESARVIAALNRWLLDKQLEFERKPNKDGEALGYVRGISDARAQLEELTRSAAPADTRTGGDDDGP